MVCQDHQSVKEKLISAKCLEDRCLANVVGCSLAFINNTLTKNGMKEVFKKHGVSTPLGFGAKNSCNLELEINTLSMAYPLFVKVNDSILFFDAGYGSVGIDENSVCHNYKQLKEKCDALWVDFGELTIEEFILGTEFSVLISGGPPYNNESLQVYQPAIRSFNEKIPAHQRFIKYAQNWDDDLCEHKYQKCEESDFSPLVELATNAYISVSGNCFGRVDIRKRENGKFYVLEVNSSCGIGFGSSSDNILLLAGQCTLDFFKAVLCTLPIARAIIGEKQTFRQVNERDLMCVSGDRSSTLKVQ